MASGNERTEDRALMAYVVFCGLGVVTSAALVLMGGLS